MSYNCHALTYISHVLEHLPPLSIFNVEPRLCTLWLPVDNSRACDMLHRLVVRVARLGWSTEVPCHATAN